MWKKKKKKILNRNVRQGCSLSPIFFNKYIDIQIHQEIIKTLCSSQLQSLYYLIRYNQVKQTHTENKLEEAINK